MDERFPWGSSVPVPQRLPASRTSGSPQSSPLGANPPTPQRLPISRAGAPLVDAIVPVPPILSASPPTATAPTLAAGGPGLPDMDDGTLDTPLFPELLPDERRRLPADVPPWAEGASVPAALPVLRQRPLLDAITGTSWRADGAAPAADDGAGWGFVGLLDPAPAEPFAATRSVHSALAAKYEANPLMSRLLDEVAETDTLDGLAGLRSRSRMLDPQLRADLRTALDERTRELTVNPLADLFYGRESESDADPAFVPTGASPFPDGALQWLDDIPALAATNPSLDSFRALYLEELAAADDAFEVSAIYDEYTNIFGPDDALAAAARDRRFDELGWDPETAFAESLETAVQGPLEFVKGTWNGFSGKVGQAVSGVGLLMYGLTPDPTYTDTFKAFLEGLPAASGNPEMLGVLRRQVRDAYPYGGREAWELLKAIAEAESGTLSPDEVRVQIVRPTLQPLPEDYFLYRAGDALSNDLRIPYAEGWEDSRAAIWGEGLGEGAADTLAQRLGGGVGGMAFEAAASSAAQVADLEAYYDSIGREPEEDEIVFASRLGYLPALIGGRAAGDLTGTMRGFALASPAIQRRLLTRLIAEYGIDMLEGVLSEGGEAALRNLMARSYDADRELGEGVPRAAESGAAGAWVPP